jgi:cell division transport system ATP-binding protein
VGFSRLGRFSGRERAPFFAASAAADLPAGRADVLVLRQIAGSAPWAGQYHDGLNRFSRIASFEAVADFRVHVQEPDSGLTQTRDPEAGETPLVRVRRVLVEGCPAAISFDVPPGGAVAIVESRAQAASVVLRLLARVSPPRSGSIEIFGEDPARLPATARAALRRRIGSIPRDLALAEELDAFDNLALAARATGRRPGDYAGPARELLAWVGVGRREGEASGGLDEEGRRRLALARALVNRPEILIADEPTGALEGDARRGLLRLIGELHAAGTAVLMASRDAELAERSGARVVRLTGMAGGEALAGAA